jgi:uncharacterized membrane protein YkvA (DUF1232 family)
VNATGPAQQTSTTAAPAPNRFARGRHWARRVKRDTYALFLAARDPRTPWYAKVCAACLVAYAFSPLDLIPDVIPVLGYLDDVIIVPLGILLVLRLVPPAVMADCRARAEANRPATKPRLYAGALAVVLLWLLAFSLGLSWALRLAGVW